MTPGRGLHKCLRPVGQQAARQKLLALEGSKQGRYFRLLELRGMMGILFWAFARMGARTILDLQIGVRMATSPALDISRQGVAAPRWAAMNSASTRRMRPWVAAL